MHRGLNSALPFVSRCFVVAALLLLSSCGARNDGPPRYALSGTITYGGKPVPAGDILFEPDSASGNSGPAGIGVISNGRFKTIPGKGTIGGRHTIKVFGYDGLNRSEPSPNGQQLFAMQSISLDLPKATAVQNIDLEKLPPSNKK